MALPTLPLELLSNICENVDQPRDFLALSTTCQALRNGCKAYLYRSVRTTKRFDVVAVVKMLLMDPSIIPLIKSLQIKGWRKTFRNQREAATRGKIESNALRNLPTPEGDHDWIKTALANSKNYDQGDVNAVRLLLAMLPHLEQLHVHDDSWVRSWLERYQKPGQALPNWSPILPHLTSLYLEAGARNKIGGELFFRCLALPSLRRLHVIDVVWGPERDWFGHEQQYALEELDRRGSTVEHLQLDRANCDLQRLEKAIKYTVGHLRHFGIKWMSPGSRHEAFPGNYFVAFDLPFIKEALEHVKATLEEFELSLDYPIRDYPSIHGTMRTLGSSTKLRSLRLDHYAFVGRPVLNRDRAISIGHPVQPLANFFPPSIESVDFCDISDWLPIEERNDGSLYYFDDTNALTEYLASVFDAKATGKLPKLKSICLNDVHLGWIPDWDSSLSRITQYPLGKRPTRKEYRCKSKTELKNLYNAAAAVDVKLVFAPAKPLFPNTKCCSRSMLDDDPFGLRLEQ